MNRRFFSSLLVGMMLALSFIASGELSAQSVIKECACKYVTVRVAPEVACKVTVVFIYPDQPLNPATVIAPGTEVQLRCAPGTEITVVDCMNRKNPLGADGCLRSFAADVGCCIDACLTKDENGCLLLDIRPSGLKCRCI